MKLYYTEMYYQINNEKYINIVFVNNRDKQTVQCSDSSEAKKNIEKFKNCNIL
jgi:hypothetical protein